MSGLLDKRPVPDWATVDWRSHVFDATLDGRRMRYVDLGAGDGPPLVLVHGTGGSWQSWLLNLGELARDRRVIAVDLPGFGGSDPLDVTAGLEDYAGSVAALLAALGVDRAIAVGHSLGGLVALRLALRQPPLVTALVIVDGGGAPLSRVRLRLVTSALLAVNTLLSHEPVMRAVITRSRARRWLVAGAMRDPGALTPALAAEMLASFTAPGLLAAVAAGARDDVAERVHEVACPALLLWGRHDRLIPLALAEALAQRMRNVRLEVIEGAGHCPMIERPQAFNHAVATFASQHDREEDDGAAQRRRR